MNSMGFPPVVYLTLPRGRISTHQMILLDVIPPPLIITVPHMYGGFLYATFTDGSLVCIATNWFWSSFKLFINAYVRMCW